MASVGGVGSQLDLAVKQGAHFGPVKITLKDPITKQPVKLGGATVSAQARKTPDAEAVALQFVATIDADPDDGVLYLEANEAATAALDAGATYRDPASQYVWDLILTDSTGRKVPVLWGLLVVHPGVTRAV